MLQGGGVAQSTRSLLDWMEEEGMGDKDLKAVNWEDLGYGQIPGSVTEMADEPLERFFLSHTKAELSKGSVERRIVLFPVAKPADIRNHPQLEARDYFQELPHPELETSVTYPGAFVKVLGEELVGLRRRPPLIGEHNREIYQKELGLTPEELTALKEGLVI